MVNIIKSIGRWMDGFYGGWMDGFIVDGLKYMLMNQYNILGYFCEINICNN
ncbi:hypothetical protein BDB01DRAFT_780443, partial [Pilobolus umbonatus]